MRGRGRGGDGGSDPDDETVLGAVGLGAFALLALPDHQPEVLGLHAAYDDGSGRILVSVTGGAVSASPADLAAALELPNGPVGLPAGVDAAVFSSAEAIAAVSGFVRDRLILGGGAIGGPPSGEVAAALRLVEEGKPYDVDWGVLVWALVKAEVVAGTPRLYAPYLLHLMERQRPELFAGPDGILPLGKRWKGSQWSGGMLLDSEYFGLEEEGASLMYGANQNIGDLEDMSFLSEGKKLAFVGGEQVPSLSQGNAEHGSQIFFHSDVSLLGHQMECDDRKRGNSNSYAKQDDYLSQQQMVSMTQSQPELKPQRLIEVEDDNNVKVDDIPLIRNGPLGTTAYLPQLQEVGGIHNYQTPSPFQIRMQQIRGYVPAMESKYLDIEKACRDTQEDVERIKKMVMEKDHLYAATVSGTVEELRVKGTTMRSLEADLNMMRRTVQQLKESLEKSSAQFQEYRNKIKGGEGADSYSNVLGTSRVQQVINRIDQAWSLKSQNIVKKITELETVMPHINHEVQRLKDARSIPDLNNGMEDFGEGEASLSKTVGGSSGGEGCLVSNTTQGVKQLVELIANPDQRNIAGESMHLDGEQRGSSERNIAGESMHLDGEQRGSSERNIAGESMHLDGEQRGSSEDEACHGSAASQGTS